MIMKPEQIELMQYLGAKGAAYGELWDRVFESAFSSMAMYAAACRSVFAPDSPL